MTKWNIKRRKIQIGKLHNCILSSCHSLLDLLILLQFPSTPSVLCLPFPPSLCSFSPSRSHFHLFFSRFSPTAIPRPLSTYTPSPTFPVLVKQHMCSFSQTVLPMGTLWDYKLSKACVRVCLYSFHAFWHNGAHIGKRKTTCSSQHGTTEGLETQEDKTFNTHTHALDGCHGNVSGQKMWKEIKFTEKSYITSAAISVRESMRARLRVCLSAHVFMWLCVQRQYSCVYWG